MLVIADITTFLRLQKPITYSRYMDFVFDSAPSADNYIVAPDYPAEAYFQEKT